MIKKLLLIPIAVFLLHSLASGQACSPDPQAIKNGVHPDSATGFDTAFVNAAYSQLVTIVVPKDTNAFPPFPALVWDSTRLDSVSGLPSSLTLACWNNNGFGSSSRCTWKGNTKGCAIITGTPTAGEVGTWKLKFYTKNFVGGSATPITYTISYYEIVVVSASGINENPGIQNLLQNNPNPFTSKSEILFTAEDNGIARFKIYNMIGTVVQEYEISVKKGINKLELDAKDFDSGIYFYSIATGNNILTRKMIVKK